MKGFHHAGGNIPARRMFIMQGENIPAAAGRVFIMQGEIFLKGGCSLFIKKEEIFLQGGYSSYTGKYSCRKGVHHTVFLF